MSIPTFAPAEVLDFWFPDDGHWTTREGLGAFFDKRMQGGMDGEILARFGPLTEAAARGVLDSWAETPRGRLALLIALDQFPRSYWRDTPAAYGQDIKAARLALEGLANGHFDALEAAWEMVFYQIAISHCEGPEHLTRMRSMDPLVARIVAALPPHLAEVGLTFTAQHIRVAAIIERFGRHPHRNAVLGRVSSAEEAAYIATGDFPHLRSARPGT